MENYVQYSIRKVYIMIIIVIRNVKIWSPTIRIVPIIMIPILFMIDTVTKMIILVSIVPERMILVPVMIEIWSQLMIFVLIMIRIWSQTIEVVPKIMIMAPIMFIIVPTMMTLVLIMIIMIKHRCRHCRPQEDCAYYS